MHHKFKRQKGMQFADDKPILIVKSEGVAYGMVGSSVVFWDSLPCLCAAVHSIS